MAKKETTEEVTQTAPAYAYTQLNTTVEAPSLQEANEKVKPSETPEDTPQE